MTTLLHRLEAAPIRAALFVLERLGPLAASNLGGAIARTIGPLLPVTKVGDANLRLVMPELDAAARKRILLDVWDNLGRTTGEFPHLGQLKPTESGPGWEIEGVEHLHWLREKGGPAIMISGHIGNWEMMPPLYAQHGIVMSSFFRAASNPVANEVINELRLRAAGVGVSYFAKGSAGARVAMAHLKAGGFLGMVVDQKMNDGIASPFFGRPAMTAPAAAAFALRYRCPVIPSHVERLGPARLRFVVEAPMDLPDSGDKHADLQTLTDAINAKIEGWIRKRPGEWLWLHRRWPKP